MSNQWLLLDLEHVGTELLWWRPNSCGYTRYIDKAGIYTTEEAKTHIDTSRTAAIPREEAYLVSNVVVSDHYALELLKLRMPEVDSAEASDAEN